MTVIDDIFLVGFKFDLVDGAEAVQQEGPFSTDFEYKEPLPAQQSPAQALHLVIQFDRLGAGKKSVLLHHVLVDAVELQHDDFSGNRRRQEYLARPSARPKRLEEKLFAGQELP